MFGVLAGVVLIAVLLSVPLTTSEPGPSGLVVGGHPLSGEPAPEVELVSLDGETVRLSDLRGRPVLLNFWATWCIPCRNEFPLMVEAYERHADDGLEILGVIHDDGPESARAFAEERGARWPMLPDPGDVAWDAYAGAVMPTTFFIDRAGVVASVSIGEFREAGLAAVLERIIAEG